MRMFVEPPDLAVDFRKSINGLIVVVHDISDADKVCDCCQGALHKIGEDKSEKLEFIPAQVKVIETVRPKYACRACEKDGIALSRQTMADWMMKTAILLEPLVERLHELILKQSVIQADETTLKVIKEDKSTCYMWLYCTSTDSPTNNAIPNIVLYDYQHSRAGRCATDFLGNYAGYLHVDGYQGYEQRPALPYTASLNRQGQWPHPFRLSDVSARAN